MGLCVAPPCNEHFSPETLREPSSLTLLVASAVIFAVLEVLPGNAAEVMLGETATPESVAALNPSSGWTGRRSSATASGSKGCLTGELGTSITYDTPIAELIGERLAVTVPLALMAMALTRRRARARHLRGVAPQPARRRRRDGREPDRHRDPEFLVRDPADPVFAVKLQWFSAGGFPGWSGTTAAAWAGVKGADAAGGGAGRGAGRDPRPHHALGGARRAARRLRAHRARQGPDAARHCGGTCCATQSSRC